MDKPKYPIALIAYDSTSDGDFEIKRQVVFNSADESEFRKLYGRVADAIKEDRLNDAELKNLNIPMRVIYKIPRWAWVVMSTLAASLIAIIIALLSGWLEKVLELC